jgi:hypothetical protein
MVRFFCVYPTHCRNIYEITLWGITKVDTDLSQDYMIYNVNNIDNIITETKWSTTVI